MRMNQLIAMKESLVFKSFEAIPPDPDSWSRRTEERPRLSPRGGNGLDEGKANRLKGTAAFTSEDWTSRGQSRWGINE